MAILPEQEPETLPQAPPLAWVTGYRWAGDRGVDIQTQECNRAAWLAAHWAKARGYPLQVPFFFNEMAETVAQPVPPPIEKDMAAELLCHTCAQHAVCHGLEPMARSCRTCRHVIVSDGWFCGVDGGELSVADQREGCISWVALP